MSGNSKFLNFGTFQPVENMDPYVRAQQNSFNGRIFLPPINVNGETFENVNADYEYSNNQNGMIQMNQNEYVKQYELYKDSSKPQNTDVSIISNIVVPNALSRTYFSNDNVERIQRQIVSDVFKQYNKPKNLQ